MPEFDFGSLLEKEETKEEIEESPKKVKPLPKPKLKTKSQKSKKAKKSKKTRNGFNQSLELNLIKALYANRFGSTTNKTKSHMMNKIMRTWREK